MASREPHSSLRRATDKARGVQVKAWLQSATVCLRNSKAAGGATGLAADTGCLPVALVFQAKEEFVGYLVEFAAKEPEDNTHFRAHNSLILAPLPACLALPFNARVLLADSPFERSVWLAVACRRLLEVAALRHAW